MNRELGGVCRVLFADTSYTIARRYTASPPGRRRMMKILYLAFMKLGNVRYAATMCSVLQCKLCDTLAPPILSY